MSVAQSDHLFAARVASAVSGFQWARPGSRWGPFSRRTLRRGLTVRAFHGVEGANAVEKPPLCTADELHYVSVANSNWRLALWRYTPSPQAPGRNRPLLLLSGVGTNAIGYDLSPESSFARYMSKQGFDTWILEVRGAGLSTDGNVNQFSATPKQIASAVEPQLGEKSQFDGDLKASSLNGNKSEMVSESNQRHPLTNIIEIFMSLPKKLFGFFNRGSPKAEQNFAPGSPITDLSQSLVNIFERGQRLFPPQVLELRQRLSAVVELYGKLPDLIEKYDWDFDHYLEEDVPAAVEYIRTQCKPKDGKVHAIGHSMGGILLYAMLSRYGFEGRDSGLASAITLASSLDYKSSKSSLKLLLPLVNPAQALNVTILPLGVLLTAAYPFASRPPYVLSWLSPQISARDMMQPELFERLILNNFCTIPVKLLLQLKTVFEDGGLCDRSGKFIYKDHLRSSNVPILAIAGDHDLICPPEAVHETVKFIPKGLVTHRVFGEPNGPHYAHYDLVAGRSAADEVYPCLIEFLTHHDGI